MPTQTSVHLTALQLYDKGFNVFPVCDGSSPHTHFSPATQSQIPCESLGKRPVTQWRKFGDFQTREQVDALFANHQGNIGIALKADQVVLDVDAKSGGLLTLKALIDEHEIDTETPHARTGGGGVHYYYRQGATAVRNGTDVLRHLDGMSGVDVKAHGGYVVAPPSRHASGQLYEWLWSALDQDADPAVFPAALIDMMDASDLALQAPVKGSGPQSKDTGKYLPKYSWEQVVKKFKSTYYEGQRNSELVSMAGILRARMGGVCVDCACNYFHWAQEESELFSPALAPHEIDLTVRGVYDNYGHPEKKCLHGSAERLLKGLYRAVKADASGEPANIIQFDEGARKVRANERQKEWFAVREQTLNSHPHTLVNLEGMWMTVSGADAPLLLANPANQPSAERIAEMVRTTYGKESKLAERIETCGRFAALVCSEHGERGSTPMSDRSKFCPHCSSQPAAKLKWAEALPDAAGDKVYREVWIRQAISTKPTESSYDLQMNLGNAFNKTAQVFRGWANRKRTKGRVTHRTAGFVLDRPLSFMLWKFQILEDSKGDLDDMIADLVKKMGGMTYVVQERWTQSGERALRQAMSDASSVFDALWDDADFVLFEALLYALTRRNVFQPMGMLRGEMMDIDVPDSPPMVCDVAGCGRALAKVPKLDDDGGAQLGAQAPAFEPDLQALLAI